MKTWVKVLMWLGLGGGIGFFAGYRIGQNSGYQAGYDEGWNSGFNEPEDKQKAATDAMNQYRGDNTDGDTLPETHVHRDPAKPDEVEVFRSPFIQRPLVSDDSEMPMDEPVIDDPAIEGYEETTIPQMHMQHMVPESITEEEYAQNPWEAERRVMSYYEGDEVLYDRHDRNILSIDEAKEVLGLTWWYGFRPNANTVIDDLYFRNETYGKIYHVIRLDSASSDTVNGIDSPEYEEDEDDFNQRDL